MIGLVTALARAEAEEAKGRKRRERERAGLPPEGSRPPRMPRRTVPPSALMLTRRTASTRPPRP